jgi:hypothetical protein
MVHRGLNAQLNPVCHTVDIDDAGRVAASIKLRLKAQI